MPRSSGSGGELPRGESRTPLDALLLQAGANLAITPRAELDQALQTILARLLTELDAGFAVFQFYTHIDDVLTLLRQVTAGIVPDLFAADGQTAAAAWFFDLAAAGKPVYLHRGAALRPPELEWLHDDVVRHDLHALLLIPLHIPLHIKDSTFACLAFGSYTGAPVWDAATQQGLAAFATILGGILRRQAIENALRDDQEQLRTTIDAARLDVWTLNLRDPARSFATTFHYNEVRSAPVSLSEVVELVLGRVHPEDRPRLAQLLAGCVRGEVESLIESYRLRMVGQEDYLWVESHAFLVRDTQGQPLRLTGFSQDISARKTLEDMLESRRQELLRQARLMEQTERLGQIGGWELEVATGELYWTPETYRIHDVLPGDYTPTVANLVNFYTPESARLLFAAIQRTIALGESYDLKLQLITAKQRQLWVRATGCAVLEAGQIVRLYGTCQDITERTELEDRLRQAQNLEGVGQLAGGIAHDFNNLLTAVNGFSELAAIYLQRVPPHPDVARVSQYLKDIHIAGRRASELTRQLLAFSRRQVLRPRPLQVGDGVDEAMTLLRRFIRENVHLTIRVVPNLGQIMADPSQLEQVMVSLVINANDAMPHGGEIAIDVDKVVIPAEEVRHTLDLSAGEYIEIRVRDTGDGMTPEVLQRCFEPFFTTKPVGKGTGLGLAMVYGIVKQSGGHITVESTVGVGTTFRLLWPRYQPESASQDDGSPS